MLQGQKSFILFVFHLLLLANQGHYWDFCAGPAFFCFSYKSIQGLCWLQLFILLLLIRRMIKVSFALASGIIQEAADVSLWEHSVVEILLSVVPGWGLHTENSTFQLQKQVNPLHDWKFSLEEVNTKFKKGKEHINDMINRHDLLDVATRSDILRLSFLKNSIMGSTVQSWKKEGREREREEHLALVLSHTHQKKRQDWVKERKRGTWGVPRQTETKHLSGFNMSPWTRTTSERYGVGMCLNTTGM